MTTSQGLRRAEEQWGTVITIDVHDPVHDPIADGAVDDCYAWFRRVDDLFSTWRPETEIMRIGRGELAPENAAPEVQEVLLQCEQLRRDTRGAFDISAGGLPGVEARPGRAPLDPSGFVKGWAVARAATMLREAGARNFFVSAGGDMVAVGGWRVGIQHPWERDRVAAVLWIDDAAVATSGRYERGDHVLDPRTGLPARGLMSVTVVGADLARADAYATAVMVLGPREGLAWLTTAGYEGMAITDDRTVISTPGFAQYRAA